MSTNIFTVTVGHTDALETYLFIIIYLFNLSLLFKKKAKQNKTKKRKVFENVI